MFFTFFLGDYGVHPTTYDKYLLLEETSGVRPRLRDQVRQQPPSPSALIFLIQKEFNESFRQELEW